MKMVELMTDKAVKVSVYKTLIFKKSGNIVNGWLFIYL